MPTIKARKGGDCRLSFFVRLNSELSQALIGLPASPFGALKKKPVVLENKAWLIARLMVTGHEIAAAPGQYASTLKEQRVDPK